MVRNLVFLFCVAIVAGGCANVEKNRSACDKQAKVLRHVVMFKFNEAAGPEDIRKVESDFAALRGKIDAICDFEWGTNVSVENVSQGFTHCFVVTFSSEEARQEYLPHPAHKEFAASLRPFIEKVLVVDYWTAQ